MHVLPGTVQSEALTHWVRHLPSAQIRPVWQSLLSEQPMTVAGLELEQAGTTAAAAKMTPMSRSAPSRTLARSAIVVFRVMVRFPF
jgi:hypothetical protein